MSFFFFEPVYIQLCYLARRNDVNENHSDTRTAAVVSLGA